MGVGNLPGPGEGPGYEEGDEAESGGGWLLFSGAVLRAGQGSHWAPLGAESHLESRSDWQWAASEREQVLEMSRTGFVFPLCDFLPEVLWEIGLHSEPIAQMKMKRIYLQNTCFSTEQSSQVQSLRGSVVRCARGQIRLLSPPSSQNNFGVRCLTTLILS